jgi:hypothetical protein
MLSTQLDSQTFKRLQSLCVGGGSCTPGYTFPEIVDLYRNLTITIARHLSSNFLSLSHWLASCPTWGRVKEQRASGESMELEIGPLYDYILQGLHDQPFLPQYREAVVQWKEEQEVRGLIHIPAFRHQWLIGLGGSHTFYPPVVVQEARETQYFSCPWDRPTGQGVRIVGSIRQPYVDTRGWHSVTPALDMITAAIGVQCLPTRESVSKLQVTVSRFLAESTLLVGAPIFDPRLGDSTSGSPGYQPYTPGHKGTPDYPLVSALRLWAEMTEPPVRAWAQGMTILGSYSPGEEELQRVGIVLEKRFEEYLKGNLSKQASLAAEPLR